MINTLRVLTRPWPLVTVWSPQLPCLSMIQPRWELGAPPHQAYRDVTCKTFNIVKLEEYLLSLYIFNDNTDPLKLQLQHLHISQRLRQCLDMLFELIKC